MGEKNSHRHRPKSTVCNIIEKNESTCEGLIG
uniref:Uncharacterized protein n=1 Tax=Anguilla anguilla TaxID=7936 RepID=A0A0E9RBX9_ANGAN